MKGVLGMSVLKSGFARSSRNRATQLFFPMEALPADLSRMFHLIAIEPKRGATGKVCLNLSKNSCKRKSARDGVMPFS
jgi:hypothetical protein